MAERTQDRLKRLIVKRLRLSITPDSIGDDHLLFGKEGLGLDSIDALELVVGMEEEFGIRIGDNEVDRAIFRSVSTLSQFAEKKVAVKVAT